MPRSAEPTIKFNVDIAELKAGIQEANRQIRLANSEFKDASAGMAKWEESADGVSAKLTQLKTVLTAQNKVLDDLEKQYRLVAEEQGESSKGAQELAIKINNQRAAVKATEKDIGKYNQTLADIEAAAKQADSGTNDLSDGLSKTGDSAGKTEGEVTSLAGALKNGLVTGLKAAAVGIGGLVTAFLATGEASQDHIEDMGKLETAYQSAGKTVEQGQQAYKDFVGILGETDQSVEAVNHLAKLTTSQKELSDWTNIAAGVYATFGDSLPLEGLTEAANETAKVGQVTGPLADALNWAGVSEDDFNKKLEATNSEQERAQLITSTLTGLYSDAGKTYQEVNADLIAAREAQAGLTDAMAEVGAVAMPITTELKNGFADVMHAAADMLTGLDGEKIAGSIRSGFETFTNDILPKVKEGFEWVKSNSPIIASAIATIGGAIAAAFVVNKVTAFIGVMKTMITAFTTAPSVIAGVKAAMTALNITMTANPIGLIVTLLAGLVAGFVTLWNTSDGFRNFWIGLWENVKNTASGAVDWIVEKFNLVINFIRENWQELLLLLVNPFVGGFKLLYDNCEGFRTFVDTFIANVKQLLQTGWDNIVTFFTESVPAFIQSVVDWFNELPGKIYDMTVNALGHLLAWGIQLFEFARTKIPEFIDAVIKFFSELPGKIWTWLTDAFNKIVTWGANIIASGKEKASAFLEAVISFFKTLPSRVWEWLSNAYTKVTTWGLNIVSSGKQKASEFLDSVISFFKDLPGKAKEWLDDSIEKIVSWGSDMLEKGKQAASDTVNAVIDGFKELPDKLFQAGKDALNGFWDGLKSVGESIANWASNFFGDILNKAEDVLEIGSPSKAFRRIGKWSMEGFGGGFAEEGKHALVNVKKTFGGVVDTAKATLAPTVQNLKSNVSGALSGLQGRVAQATSNVNYNFYQTNNSPKALSRLEIYRQSKNLLKGVTVRV